MPPPAFVSSSFFAANSLRRAMLGRARSRGLHLARDLAYGPDPAHRVDTWRPPGTDPLPTVVLLHGGGWVQGTRRDFASLAPLFARRGLLAVAADYRLARPWPAALDDVVTLLHALPRFGADPARIDLWGHSAGGHLALLAACRVPVRGVVALGSPADLRLLSADERALTRPVFGAADLGAVSPLSHAPPGCDVLLVHGTADPVCAIDGARALARSWGATIREVPGGDHGLRWPPRACLAARRDAFAWACAHV